MSKEKLLKGIFEHYGYEYEILEEWLLTLEESNKCYEKVPLLWSEEEIELITSI